MLPIFSVKELLIETIRSNPVTVVRGSTGSGKSTQLPIILMQAGFAKAGSVIITEPRRAAAVNVAEFVARQLGEPLGKHVGYQVRFERVGGRETVIRFITAGIVLREILRNPLLKGCSVLVIDEVHENNIESDLLVSLVSEIIKKRQDLHVVLMSATLDVSAYSAFFGDIPVVDIPGRAYPIEIKYAKRDLSHVSQVIDEAVKVATDIISKGDSGDILIFMPGRESIEAVIEQVMLVGGRNVIALPLYRDLEPVEQRKVYQSFPGQRKIVVATNIAETSVTIENIKYVIDSGLIKNTAYLDGVQCLLVENHSQSGCVQRSGRAGRVGPGICYRLYTERSFNKRALYSIPEIERADPSQMLLYLKELGRDVRAMKLIHAPSKELIMLAEKNLRMLGALSDDGNLTKIGKCLISLPLEPHIGNLVMESVRQGCVREVLTFVSFLSRTSVFLRPFGKEAIAEKRHMSFVNQSSDALTTIGVWNGYVEAGYSRGWCYENFINIQAIEEAKRVRDQLARIILRWKIPISRGTDEVLLKCIVRGMRFNLLKRDGSKYRGVYRQVGDVSMLPQSPFRSSKPEYVVAADLLKTKYCYAIYVTEAKPEWLKECLPDAAANGSLPAPAPVSVISYPDPRLITLAFTKEGDKYVTQYGGERILKTNKGGKIEPDKPYKCRIVEILGVNFAEIVSDGSVEKPAADEVLAGMAEELATSWQCNFRSE